MLKVYELSHLALGHLDSKDRFRVNLVEAALAGTFPPIQHHHLMSCILCARGCGCGLSHLFVISSSCNPISQDVNGQHRHLVESGVKANPKRVLFSHLKV